VAAAVEAGSEVEIHSMSAVIPYQRLVPYAQIAA